MATQTSKASRTRRNNHANLEPGIPAQSPRIIRAPRRAVVGSGASNVRASSLHSFKLPGDLPPKSTSVTKILKNGNLDTNPKSYDRRDPFTAFNTLIKLLASLPSRVITGSGGGRQFKLLSLEEHRLCMHLCNLVEPFLLSSPFLDTSNKPNMPNAIFKARTLLVHQPTEILDCITSFIEARGDLMNFGTSCKRLGDVVFPRHWEYRFVRAKISMSGVWKHLCERTDLAANVRVVEVLDERSERKIMVPKVCRKAGGISGGKTSFGIQEQVVSATSTSEEDSSSSSANETEGRIGKLSMHKKHEKYFAAALAEMTALVTLKWEGNHSPISVVDNGTVWRAIVRRCGGSLSVLEVVDNMVFSPLTIDDSEEERKRFKPSEAILVNLRSASFRSTHFNYGATREPEMNRIGSILHQCPNLESLEITYKAPKASSPAVFPAPVANEFLAYGRWSRLTSLTLSNLSCLNAIITMPAATPSQDPISSTTHTVQQNPLQTFLSAHPGLQVLKLLNLGPPSQFRRLRTPLERNTLPMLRELHASRDIVNMILKAECDEPRPLEIIKGFKLVGAAGTNVKYAEFGNLGHDLSASLSTSLNLEFYRNLKRAGGSVRRIEAEAWGDLDDVRMLTWCVPGLTWLDVGRRLRPGNSNPNGIPAGSSLLSSRGGVGQGPVTNMIEWAEILSSFEELTTFHGIKFFYELSPNAVPSGGTINEVSTGSNGSGAVVVPMGTSNANISMTDRSRTKKNDEIAGVLAWKCRKLRRVDHWEGPSATTGKVIVLLRDSDARPGVEGKVRWDVRRVKQ